MEPAVPFFALGTVTLLAVAGWAVLGAAGLALRGPRPPALLLLGGAVLLGGVEIATAVGFSQRTSDVLALLRGAGGLLLAGGLSLGALDRRPSSPAAPGRAAPAAPEPAALGVVVPLGAGPLPAGTAAAAALAAAALALRGRRDAAGLLLGCGLVASAVAAGASAAAGDSAAVALAVLVLRGLGAVLLLAGALALGRRSLLAKVVAAILAAVLVMATAAFGVVGTAVVASYERQAAELVTDTAQARVAALAEEPERLRPLARVLQQIAATQPPEVLRATFQELVPDDGAFLVRVPVGGTPTLLQTKEGAPALEAAELAGFPALPVVARALATREAAPGLVRLPGPNPRLASVVAVPAPTSSPELPVPEVVVYGTPVDDSDLEVAERDEGYRVAVLSGDPLRVTATNAERLEAEVLREAAGRRGPAGGRTLAAEGDAPTIRVEPLPDPAGGPPLGYLAVSRSADIALEGQRSALTALLLAALAATTAVGLLAVLLGRRTVDPVRRLTAAAERVAAGDLSVAAPAVRADDEVGTLTRTFATMTGSLATLTGDLRSTAARLETVLASMTDGLLATDAEGRVTSANRAAAAMLGCSSEALVGLPLAEAVDVRDAAGQPLVDPSRQLGDVPGDVHRPDGSTLPVRVALSPLRGDGGVVLVLRDTTREREVERMKTEFLSNVSHELRTPLTPIRGYADILSTRAERLQPAQVATFAGTILSETLKMNRVVDLLVDVAAIEAGRVRLRPRDVDVRELVEGRLAVWRERVPARAQDLRQRVAAGLPTVHVDPEWVAKALDELLDNALKHTPPGTSVTLAAARQDGAVRVAVRDTGPGIAEEDLPLLFTSFEQVDGSATRKVGGLGLGLSFVRRLAEDTGLPLHVESTVGRGSAFALDLPAGQEPAPPRRRRVRARA